MDVLWTGLAISVVVGFVFYVLAIYWQRLLRGHSRAIRALSDRIEALEEMEDPRFRRKVGDSAPSPLEQVYVFSFRLSERFWADTIGASNEQLCYIRERGIFLSSVKIERWRSHIAVTLTELLPENQSAGWRTRTVDIYPTKETGTSASLWELYLESPENSRPSDLPSAVELRLEHESLVLRARGAVPHRGPALQVEGKAVAHSGDKTIFEVPLDGDRLAAFRAGEDGADGDALFPAAPGTDSWLAFYRGEDEGQGVDWQLCLRDLDRKAIWERWNITEPWQARRVS